MLALAEGLPQESFQPVAHDGVAGGLAHRDAETRIAVRIGSHVQSEQMIPGPPAVIQHGFELAVARQPPLLWKGQGHL